MSLMTTYKVGQGRQMRTGVLWLLIGIAAWGCYSFMEYGNSKLDRLFGNAEPFFSKGFAGDGSSMTSWLTPSFVLALLLFVGCLFWFRKMLNKESTAEHLIGTELELRRVKWPSKQEVLTSGSRVIYYTAMLALVIAILDFDMATIVQHYVLRQPLSETGWGRLIAMIPGAAHNTMVLEIGTLTVLGIQAFTLISLSKSAASNEKED